MKPLKITKIELFKADIELNEPFVTALATVHFLNNIVVKTYTDVDVYGLGESKPNRPVTGESQGTALMAAAEYAEQLIGKNPLNIAARATEMQRFLHYNPSARNAIELSLWDILGKVAGLPLYALLGGGRREFWSDNTISLGEPDAMVARALQYKKEGFFALKVKLGTDGSADVARIASIREAVGPEMKIRIDANQGWDYRTALLALRAMEAYDVEYCEQPLAAWDFEHMRLLRENSNIPIMADESLFDSHEALKLACGGCCDIFNIKLAKSAGIRGAERINAVAEAAGIPCMVGCMTETRLGLTAAAHFVSARPNVKYVDLDGHRTLKFDPVIGGATFRPDAIIVPDAPGIGADFDPAFLEGCEKQCISG